MGADVPAGQRRGAVVSAAAEAGAVDVRAMRAEDVEAVVEIETETFSSPWRHDTFASLLGLYLGAVALLTGSVAACILCHAANNLVAVAGAVAGIGAGGPASAPVGLALAAFGLWYAAHDRRLREPAGKLSTLQPEGETDEQ